MGPYNVSYVATTNDAHISLKLYLCHVQCLECYVIFIYILVIFQMAKKVSWIKFSLLQS